MKPIRSLGYDAFWFLSGIPIGLMLIGVPLGDALAIFFILDAAHLLSPAVAVWGLSQVRKWALERWVHFLLIPVLLIAGCALLGITVGKSFSLTATMVGIQVRDPADYARPFVLMMVAYFILNQWHFGGQFFGFFCLYRKMRLGRWKRAAAKWGCFLGMVFFTVLLPRHLRFYAVGMFILGGIFFNHSLAAIGLASHLLSRHLGRSPWLIALGMLGLGAVSFWFLFMAPGDHMRITMSVVGVRVGLGLAHFWYDKNLYKRGSPIWGNETLITKHIGVIGDGSLSWSRR